MFQVAVTNGHQTEQVGATNAVDLLSAVSRVFGEGVVRDPNNVILTPSYGNLVEGTYQWSTNPAAAAPPAAEVAPTAVTPAFQSSVMQALAAQLQHAVVRGADIGAPPEQRSISVSASACDSKQQEVILKLSHNFRGLQDTTPPCCTTTTPSTPHGAVSAGTHFSWPVPGQENHDDNIAAVTSRLDQWLKPLGLRCWPVQNLPLLEGAFDFGAHQVKLKKPCRTDYLVVTEAVWQTLVVAQRNQQPEPAMQTRKRARASRFCSCLGPGSEEVLLQSPPEGWLKGSPLTLAQGQVAGVLCGTVGFVETKTTLSGPLPKQQDKVQALLEFLAGERCLSIQNKLVVLLTDLNQYYSVHTSRVGDGLHFTKCDMACLPEAGSFVAASATLDMIKALLMDAKAALAGGSQGTSAALQSVTASAPQAITPVTPGGVAACSSGSGLHGVGQDQAVAEAREENEHAQQVMALMSDPEVYGALGATAPPISYTPPSPESLISNIVLLRHPQLPGDA